MDAQNSMDIFCGAEDKDPQLPDIFTTLFLQQLASRNFSEALSALLQNPSELKRSAGLRQLLITLLADGEKKTLVKLDYGSLTETVEDNLENICGGLRVEKAEGMYDLLYSFHFERFDFKKVVLHF
uniref:NUP160 middle TPR domain-containing protein n=1 Tax=Ditylenchus dipsaci TaxID=166011 RepID=A0A915CU76_9BILA